MREQERQRGGGGGAVESLVRRAASPLAAPVTMPRHSTQSRQQVGTWFSGVIFRSHGSDDRLIATRQWTRK